MVELCLRNCLMVLDTLGSLAMHILRVSSSDYLIDLVRNDVSHLLLFLVDLDLDLSSQLLLL